MASAKTKIKLNEELTNLRKEMVLLRSLIISILGEDREGKYRPSFVDNILNAAQEKPRFEFKNPESLLAQLKR